jgi:hypothetical protein
MKKLLISAIAIMGFALPAMADTLSIGVGQPGRGYEKFGKEMVVRMADRLDAEIVNYEGSDAISRAVCDGKAQAGIMQIDAIYARQKEGCKLRVVGIYGKEYAFLMVPPNSDINALDDFDATTRILVDTAGSGTDLFWQTAVSIETGPDGNKSSWAQAKAVNDPILLAETSADIGEIDAVLMVSKPTSAEVKGLIDAGWELVEFYDKDLNDQMFNGESLYPTGTAEVEGTGGWLSGNTSSDSYTIRSFIVLNEVASKDKTILAEVARAAKAVSNGG